MVVGLLAAGRRRGAAGRARPCAGTRIRSSARWASCPRSSRSTRSSPRAANLRLFGSLQGMKGEAGWEEAVQSALALVSLADRAGDKAGHFSGGMKRRLNLGGGAAARPARAAAGRAHGGRGPPEPQRHLRQPGGPAGPGHRASSTPPTTWRRWSGCATGSSSSTAARWWRTTPCAGCTGRPRRAPGARDGASGSWSSRRAGPGSRPCARCPPCSAQKLKDTQLRLTLHDLGAGAPAVLRGGSQQQGLRLHRTSPPSGQAWKPSSSASPAASLRDSP